MAEVIKTVKPSGGDYTSLSAWEAGEQRDLVTLNEIAVAECYSMSDTTAVTINGFTTGSANYIEIRTPLSERHNGKWNTAKYRLEITTDTAAIDIQDNHVRVTGLQISIVPPTFAREAIKVSFPGVSEFRISHNILNGNANALSASAVTVSSGTTAVYKVWENICYGFHKAWTGTIAASTVAAGSYIYNNTVYDGDYGIKVAGCLLKNNVVAACNHSNYTGSFDAASDYNNSDDTTSTGGANDKVSQTVVFVNAAAKDFHLDATDTSAKDAGTDLSAFFTTDIDGQTITTWSMGADSIVSGGGGTALLKIIAENAQVSDGYVRRMAMTRPVSETTNVTEALLRRGALKRIITETQNLTEGVVKSISTLLIKVVNEGVQIAETIARRLGLTRIASESVSLPETAVRRGALRRILNETASITEGVLRRMAMVRIAAETVSLVETAVRRVGLVRIVSETLNIAEGVLKYLGLVKIVNEGMNIVEGIFKKLGLDTLGILGENLTLVFTSISRGIKSISNKRGIISKTPKREVKP